MNYRETLESLKRERTAKQTEVTKLDTAISAVQALAGNSGQKPGVSSQGRMSKEGVQRIVEAQKRRWAKVRAEKSKKRR